MESDPRAAWSVPNSPGSSSSAASAAALGSRSTSRRGTRARSSPSAAGGKSPEVVRPRALTNQINQSMAKAMGRPLEITPLELPLATLSSSLIPLGTRAAAEVQRRQPTGSGLDAQRVRAMLGSPEKLREIAILTELLQPPLAHCASGVDFADQTLSRFFRFKEFEPTTSLQVTASQRPM